MVETYVAEENYGPKMLALPNDKWREFVRIYCGQGRRNGAHAYELAFARQGKSRDASAVAATRILHDERTQAAVLEYCQKALRTLAPLFNEVVEEIASNPQAADGDRLKAVQMIADRTGLHAVSEQKMTVEHIGQDPNQLRRIAALAMALGVPVAQLVGDRTAQKVIDLTPTAQPVPAEEEKYVDDNEY